MSNRANSDRRAPLDVALATSSAASVARFGLCTSGFTHLETQYTGATVARPLERIAGLLGGLADRFRWILHTEVLDQAYTFERLNASEVARFAPYGPEGVGDLTERTVRFDRLDDERKQILAFIAGRGA